jgi:hypothetical protein
MYKNDDVIAFYTSIPERYALGADSNNLRRDKTVY